MTERRYFADDFTDEDTGRTGFYVFDRHNLGQQVGDGYPTFEAAEASADSLEASR